MVSRVALVYIIRRQFFLKVQQCGGLLPMHLCEFRQTREKVWTTESTYQSCEVTGVSSIGPHVPKMRGLISKSMVTFKFKPTWGPIDSNWCQHVCYVAWRQTLACLKGDHLLILKQTGSQWEKLKFVWCNVVFSKKPSCCILDQLEARKWLLSYITEN